MKQLFKDKKYWREISIILIIGIVVNALCFCMPLCVHAETVTTSLPYLASNNPYVNETEIANALDAISQAYPNDELQNIIVFLSSEYIWWDYNTYIPSKSYIVYNLSGFTYSSTWGTVGSNLSPNASNFDLYGNDYIDINFDNFTSYTCTYRGNIGTNYNGMYVSKTTASETTRRFYSSYQPIHIENAKFNFDYLQNYPVYTNVSWYTNDNRGDAVTYLASAISDGIIGEFNELPPLDEILNNITGNYTPHTNSTPPSYDNTLTDGQNITNAINGHSTNMNNAINNLGQNIQNFFNKLYEKLTDTGNKISQNIYNGFSTLMQNIKDFFGPKIDDLIEKVGQLVDHFSQQDTQQDINDALDNTTMHQDLASIHTLVSDSLAIWSDTDAPQEFKIPLHLEELPMFNIDKCQYIDVGLFSPTFPYLRGIMWCFLVYSVIYTVIDSIANYIGGGDE